MHTSTNETEIKMKEQRFYEIEGEKAYIYNAPFKAQATSVSIVNKSELTYYRRTFKLNKIWN